MPEQRIVITIDEEAVVTAKTEGFKGKACIEALNELLAIDNQISVFKKTDEFHQQQQISQATRTKLIRK
jgi:hypothetical protein